MLQILASQLKLIPEINYWYFSRAAAIVAFAYLWFSVFTGVLLKTKLLAPLGISPMLYKAHNTSAKLSFYFAIFHVFILYYDSNLGYGLRALFLPLIGKGSQWSIELGKWSLYCMLVLGIGVFVVRGVPARILHLCAYPCFFLALAHGLFAGTDVGLSWMQAVYWIAATSIVFIGSYHLITSFQGTDKSMKNV